jgi:hypothetical protein
MKTIFFVCPNANGFHPEGPHTCYILVHGCRIDEVLREVEVEGKEVSIKSFMVVKDPDSHVWIEEPIDSMVVRLSNLGMDKETILRVCIHCRRRGVRGISHLKEEP